MAAAVVRNIGSKLSRNVREVRIHLCQKSPGSQGVSCEVLCCPHTMDHIDSCKRVISAAHVHYDSIMELDPTDPAFCNGGKGDFIEQNYVELKKANPEFPILIRECSEVQPKLWARYDFGKEVCLPLNNLKADQVAKALESVVNSKP